MKAIILITFVLFSFFHTQAQEASMPTKKALDIKNTQNSKIDYYKALIAIGDFDVAIKNTNQASKTRTKSAFYNLLLEKNNFMFVCLTATDSLTTRHPKENKTIYKSNAHSTSALVP